MQKFSPPNEFRWRERDSQMGVIFATTAETREMSWLCPHSPSWIDDQNCGILPTGRKPPWVHPMSDRDIVQAIFGIALIGGF
jgi:hypothetical protein